MHDHPLVIDSLMDAISQYFDRPEPVIFGHPTDTGTQIMTIVRITSTREWSPHASRNYGQRLTTALLNASHTVMDVPGLPTLCPRVLDALALYRHR
jgi:hypothetical protein